MSIANLLQIVSQLGHWGYWIIFLSALLETIPLVGVFLPGYTVVIAGGFFANIGLLNIFMVMAVASLGAIAGDLAGYAIGRRYGYNFVKKYGKYFFFKEEYLERTKKLVETHTGKTLIIGRFNLITRSFAPFAAGLSDIPLAKFLFFNLIGGISWAVSSVLIGYIFGASYAVASKYIGRIVFWGIVAGLFMIYGYHFINKRRHIFKKYYIYAISFNVICIYLFSKITEDVVDGELITKIDLWVNQKMVFLHSAILNKIMLGLTFVASPYTLLALVLLLLVFLIIKKKWYYALLFFFSLAGGTLFDILIKSWVHRPRPPVELLFVSGYSFPSGHAVLSTIFFGLLIYAFKDYFKNKILKALYIGVNIFLFILIGFSRVYLGVHWLSDVLAGIALGIFWLTFLILLFRLISFAVNYFKKPVP
ncbi:MAG: bifunctional DedA family/phosphatase PAP2 family protein [Patescibacteria group bacterium]